MGYCIVCGSEAYHSAFCSHKCEKEYSKQLRDDYGEEEDED